MELPKIRLSLNFCSVSCYTNNKLGWQLIFGVQEYCLPSIIELIQIMLPVTPQTVQVTRSTHPINLVATNYVRCVTCEHYIPIESLQAHMQDHISMQVVPLAKFVNTSRPASPVKLQQSRWKGFDEQDVQTFDGSVGVDEVKRDVGRPSGTQLLQAKEERVEEVSIELMQETTQRTEATEQLVRQPDIQSQEMHQDEYFESVNIEKQYLNPSKVKFRSYLKLVQQYNDYDLHIQRKKSPPKIHSLQTTPTKYKVKQLQQPKQYRPTRKGSKLLACVEQSKRLSPGSKFSKIKTKTHKPKQPSILQQQKLHSNKASKFLSSLSFFLCGQTSKQNNLELTAPEHEHYKGNFACSGCGGFYCPVCKSTTPPQFRRPPKYF